MRCVNVWQRTYEYEHTRALLSLYRLKLRWSRVSIHDGSVKTGLGYILIECIFEPDIPTERAGWLIKCKKHVFLIWTHCVLDFVFFKPKDVEKCVP